MAAFGHVACRGNTQASIDPIQDLYLQSFCRTHNAQARLFRESLQNKAVQHKHLDRASETSRLSNVIPQDPYSNSQIWSRVEAFGRALPAMFEHVYQLTIPLHLNHVAEVPECFKNRCVQNNSIPVPTTLCKVFYCVSAKSVHPASRMTAQEGVQYGNSGCLVRQKGELLSGSTLRLCVVVPNADQDPTTPISAFVQPLDQLNTLLATCPFPFQIGRTTTEAKHTQSGGLVQQGSPYSFMPPTHLGVMTKPPALRIPSQRIKLLPILLPKAVWEFFKGKTFQVWVGFLALFHLQIVKATNTPPGYSTKRAETNRKRMESPETRFDLPTSLQNRL